MGKIIDLTKAGRKNFYRLTFDQQLEYLCNKWEVKPIGYFEHPKGRIYVAQGWQAKRPEDGTPGWTVLWAVQRRPLCLAQAIYMTTTSTRQQRIAAAVSAGMSFIREEDAERQRRAG